MTKIKLGSCTLLVILASLSWGSHYKITKSDNDYSIARKLGVSVKQLHQANPDIDWNRLHPGASIDVPSSHDVSSSKAHHSHHPKSQETVSHHIPTKLTLYRAEGDDNDWTIASKFNLKVAQLHHLNPNIDWSKLRPGTPVTVVLGSNHAMQVHVLKTRNVVVDGNNVVLRSSPSVKSQKVTTVDAGTMAKVIGRKGGWYHLKFPKGTEAWVRSDFLRPTRHVFAQTSDESQSHQSSHRSKRKVSHQESYIAEHRRTRKSKSRASHYDTYVAEKHSKRRNFNKGEVVYVPNGNGNGVISTALRYQGTRYVYGGTSRSGGFDCSGFTKAVYRKQGVSLPRTAREQSEVGNKVARKDLKKGDLIFFHTVSRGVSHVGIYIGNGKFVHASSGGHRVMVSSLSQDYYNNRFVGARRVLKTKKKESHTSSKKGKHSKS